jgi:hypothetical protein
MILLAAALTAAIQIDLDVTSLIRRAEKTETTVTCNIKTVGYRFRGLPGQTFRYAGDTYEIPAEGWVELLADRDKTNYTIADRTLPLEVWPRDQFGFREIPLPDQTRANEDAKGESR